MLHKSKEDHEWTYWCCLVNKRTDLFKYLDQITNLNDAQDTHYPATEYSRVLTLSMIHELIIFISIRKRQLLESSCMKYVDTLHRRWSRYTIITIDSVTLYAVGTQSAIIRPLNAALLTLIMHQLGGRSSKLMVGFDVASSLSLLTSVEKLIINESQI